MKRTRFYVGKLKTDRFMNEVFKSLDIPTEENFPKYSSVIGPFKTKLGAIFMARFGFNNPHCVSVNDAEKLAKKEFDRIIKEEYDMVANTIAKHRGVPEFGCIKYLPNNISRQLYKLISKNPEAFDNRVRSFRYSNAMIGSIFPEE